MLMTQDFDDIPEGLRKNLEMTDKLRDSITPILKAHEEISQLVESSRVAIPPISITYPAIDAVKSVVDNSAMQTVLETSAALKAATGMNAALQAVADTKAVLPQITGMNETMRALVDNSAVKSLGEIAIAASVPGYAFKSPILEQISSGVTSAIRALHNSTARIAANSLKGLIENLGTSMVQAIRSPALEWIQSIDLTPVQTMLRELQFDESVVKRHKEFHKAYLTAMYECKWFPYAGLSADVSVASEVADILATSRGASKRREKRIDKVFLNYYTPKEIKNIKRSWKQADFLEPHIKKILGQAIEAHLRGEYVLCITCLATMWEGLIHQKLHVTGRLGQKKTKEGFAKLIDENNFEPVFSDFYNNLIVSQCDTPEDVVEGVPNRNGISHSKYKRYPNKKASLNAILLTDFIITLDPIETQQIEEAS